MPLEAGTKLGAYEILSPLGAGGMGEVYLARDAKLDRQVAIKVLPESMTRDKERVLRFEREAKLLASLNHPNIAHIYGFESISDTDSSHAAGFGPREDTDGEESTTPSDPRESKHAARELRFLVMEYVEGETLGQRLRGGGFSVEDALDVARQMAEALEAAHDKGVVHRDLKPANVMIRPDGSVKVLDFGLAKAMADGSDATDLDPADSPTITADHTRPGVILGTAAYMSPEQARGRPIDKRTDIWSFGCVLYECLSRSRPFSGETSTDTIARILERDPDWDILPPSTPADVRTLLRRCLEKHRKERLRDIGDAVIELRDAISARSWLEPRESQAQGRRPRSASWHVVSAVVFLIGGIAVGLALSKLSTPNEPAPVIRASLLPPDNARYISIGDFEGYGSLSPSGSRIAFVARDDEGKDLIWVRPLREMDARALPGTERARNLFWSPDGASLGFFADGQLKRIDVDAGSPISLCSARSGRGATWGPDDLILFTPDFRAPVFRISALGGAPSPVTTLDSTRHTTHRWPWMLPDGEHFLYLAANHDHSQDEHAAVYFASLDGGTNKLVMRASAGTVFASGYLLSLRGRTLMAQPFDPRSGKLSGHPSAIAEDIQLDTGSWSAAYSVSNTGILAYHRGAAPGTRLTWLDRSTGALTPIGEKRSQFAMPQLSPDGKRLAVAVGNPGDIWIYELERNIGTRLTRDPAYEWNPIWSPDGRRIAYDANFGADGVNHIHATPSSGPGERVDLVKSDKLLVAMDWSPVGDYLVYWQGARPSAGAYWIKHIDSDDDPVLFLEEPFAAGAARISPNGRWIAYTSNESGTDEIYVSAFALPTAEADPSSVAAGGKQRVSTAGGRDPVWRRDGSELFYLAPGDTLIAVALNDDGDRLEVGEAATISTISVPPVRIMSTTFDVASDGQRFVFPSTEGGENQSITLVLNWPEELRRK